MTIDNFDIIKPLLKFENENIFYSLEIIQRKKENHELERHAKLIRDYYLYSVDDLDKLKSSIIENCEKYNARAYLRLNPRDAYRIALYTQKKIADLLLEGNYKAVQNAYQKVVGQHSWTGGETKKTWLIDLDDMWADTPMVDEIETFINTLQPCDVPNKVLARIPTKNGIHLITTPFNLAEFKKEYGETDVHKDNPTILYIP